VAAEDPYGIQRAAAATAIAQAEQSIFQAAWDLLKEWASKIRHAVFRTSRVPDPAAIFSTEPWFEREVERTVLVEVREIVDWAARDVDEDIIPDPNARTLTYLQQARNRLARVPETVFAQINRMTMDATTKGWSADELASEIDQILIDTGQDRWKNRALTIARTEAVGAYNAGTFRGFVSLADSLGGRWEKGWLATEDERTRPTHRHADGQRVPLLSPFSVGGYPGQFPGSPELPAQEVINCRCSMLLLRPGEQINYADRQSRARS
jgi:uncharacterized protein with gpF-like domain